MARFPKRIPPFLRLAIVASAAAGIAYGVGDLWPGDPIAPVPAAVTAVVVTSSTAARAWKTSVLQVVGIALGAGLAMLAVALLGYSALAIALMTLASYGIVAVLTRMKAASAPEAAASIAVSVIIVVGSHLSTTDTFERFLGVLVGAAIGFLLSSLATTNSSLDDLALEVDDIYADVSSLAAEISTGLHSRDASQANKWANEAISLRTRFRAVGEPLRELEESSRWSPLISRNSAERLQRRYDSLSMTITRLVAITSDLKLAQKRHLIDDAPTSVLSPLAQLFEDASATLDPEERSASRMNMTKQTRQTIQAANQSDLPTEEIAVLSGLAQNARRLVSLEDTQPLILDDESPEQRQ